VSRELRELTRKGASARFSRGAARFEDNSRRHMKLPIAVGVRDFLGIWILTPFEMALLESLKGALSPEDRVVLNRQLDRFTTVRRHIASGEARGYTEFYTRAWGKNVADSVQLDRFETKERVEPIARVLVKSGDGTIEATFEVVRGVLFRIVYASPERVFYPTADLSIGEVLVWPGRR
jgi:hypothetical protein